MNEDEKRLYKEQIVTVKRAADCIGRAINYLLVVVCMMLLAFTLLTVSIVISNNNTVKCIETNHKQVLETIELRNSETIKALWVTYFETDYLYPDQNINQNVKVGDN